MLEDLPWMEAITAHFPEPVGESLAAFDDGNDGADDDVRWVYRYRGRRLPPARRPRCEAVGGARHCGAERGRGGLAGWACAAWDGGANAAALSGERLVEARRSRGRCHVLDGRVLLARRGGAPVEIRGGDGCVRKASVRMDRRTDP